MRARGLMPGCTVTWRARARARQQEERRLVAAAVRACLRLEPERRPPVAVLLQVAALLCVCARACAHIQAGTHAGRQDNTQAVVSAAR